MANILEIKNLVVSYGGIEAVKGIDLTVEEGKIVTLVGSNGAGKSTTLKSIAGLVKPKSGDILFNGQSLLGKSTDQIVSTGVTLVPEGRRVFPNLTVEENLRIGAYLRKDSIKEDMEEVYKLFPRLKEREWQLAGTLSGGEQQMLAQNQGRHAPAQGRPAAQGQAPATSPPPPRAGLPEGSLRVWCRERERSRSLHGRGKHNTLACRDFRPACRLKAPCRNRGAAPRSAAWRRWSCRSRFPPRWRSCPAQGMRRIRRAASPAPAHRKKRSSMNFRSFSVSSISAIW